MNRDVHICRATNESAEMEFDPMKMFCPLLKLMVPPWSSRQRPPHMRNQD